MRHPDPFHVAKNNTKPENGQRARSRQCVLNTTGRKRLFFSPRTASASATPTRSSSRLTGMSSRCGVPTSRSAAPSSSTPTDPVERSSTPPYGISSRIRAAVVISVSQSSRYALYSNDRNQYGDRQVRRGVGMSPLILPEVSHVPPEADRPLRPIVTESEAPRPRPRTDQGHILGRRAQMVGKECLRAPVPRTPTSPTDVVYCP